MSAIEFEKESLLKIKNRLDSISPSFCLAKWLFLKIHLMTGKTQSCYHVPEHFADKNEIQKNPSALHNTTQKKWERRQMMAGKKPPGCSYCWRIEESHRSYSDRHYQSLNPWALPRFDEIVKKGSEYDVIPSYVELNLSNACNFKCSYCYPEYSSSIHKELKKHGPFPTSPPHNDLIHLKQMGSLPPSFSDKKESPYAKAFWKWWPELYPQLKVLRLTGGEPLIDQNSFKIMDYIMEQANKKMELAFTTNLCPPVKLRNRFKTSMEKIIKEEKTASVRLHISIDSWGPQAEYIRFGLNIRQFEDNVIFFCKDLNLHISFIITVNALSIFHLKSLFRKILEWRQKLYRPSDDLKLYDWMGLDLPYLRHPEWMTLSVLPQELAHRHLKATFLFMKDNLFDPVKKPYGFSYFQLNKMSRLLDLIRKSAFTGFKLKQNRINFYKFFNEYDARRGTHFLKTFPELEKFWRQCQKLAEEKQKATIYPVCPN